VPRRVADRRYAAKGADSVAEGVESARTPQSLLPSGRG